MNSEQAKHLNFPDLLQTLGHAPVKILKNGRELWYPSPFRNEKDPSFHISVGRLGFWIWKDFGDQGGTIIDFAMRYANVSTVREALAFLDRHANAPARTRSHDQDQTRLFSFHQQDHREAVENFSADRQLELIEAHPIQSPAILSYLTHERGISVELARRYLVEVKYRNLAVGKQFFGFGMRNESGGYEVRVALPNHKFKSAITTRDITVIPGSEPGSGTVSVFEGMTDFLSLLVLQGKHHLQEDAIIMHSLSSRGRTVEYLKEHLYNQIRTYFDNNPAGQKGTAQMQAELGPVVVSYSSVFAPHTDLNDALQSMSRKGLRRS
ncbi:MAG: hypothetical protein ABS46_14240 [Cytophagaceae bacterium SCN 52-12]|nr:MAG: hypothetical protein ABS46_14240 [Cytophagaceae bacterium SCN 52-12]